MMMGGEIVTKGLGRVTQYVSRRSVRENWSMIPIYFFALSWEVTELTRIADIALKLGTLRKSLIEFRTNSCYFENVVL